MAIIYNYKRNQPIVWFNRSLKLSNQNCLYCGVYVGENSRINSNKEHLIARQFVPDIYFTSTDFNFIFRCCETCNNRKSNIERHLSTVTLLNSDIRAVDELVNQIAINKAKKDYHPDKKGKFVIDSAVKQEVECDNLGFKVKVRFFAPPQPNETYIEELCYRQIQGLFSLLTSESPLHIGGAKLLPFENFHIFGIYPKNDWGNLQIEYFIEKTQSWFSCCNVSVANGFFKALMIVSDEAQEGWLWALEWNKSLRIIGALINQDELFEVYPDIPEHKWSPWKEGATGQTRTRTQQALTGDDLLFRENSE